VHEAIAARSAEVRRTLWKSSEFSKAQEEQHFHTRRRVLKVRELARRDETKVEAFEISGKIFQI
jgi:hypothetical protein